MAPFNVHFLIAERIWPAVKTMTTWPESGTKTLYGQFCFGCVAPDVDKLSGTLTQKDTHFYDRSGDYELMASHRSAAFLARQADFLRGPFTSLGPEQQAFGLGYLCHLAVDEVSKHLWRRETWLSFKQIQPGTAFAALDELARQQIQVFPAVAGALCSIRVPEVISPIPLCDLEQMWQAVCAFAQAETVEAEFLILVDFIERPPPERRRQRHERFRSEIAYARQQRQVFKLETMVEASLRHSRSRLADFIEGRVPEPGYPGLTPTSTSQKARRFLLDEDPESLHSNVSTKD